MQSKLQNKETDILNDETYMAIKSLCFKYLNNPDFIAEISEDELWFSIKFVFEKYNEISRLKSGLKLSHYVWPFKEIGESLDKTTIDGVTSETTKPTYYHLTKDVCYALDSLGMCLGILKIMSKNFDDLHENLSSL